MNKYLELMHKIRREKLKPNPRVVGEFLKSGDDPDKLKFLSPNNWVFHDQIVDCVLAGKYDKIMPVCAEFVTTLNCSNRCEICAYKLPKMLEGCWSKNMPSDPDCQMQSQAKARFILNKLIKYKIKGIIFTGGGEPYFFRGLEDLVQLCTEADIDSVIYTNGNFVTRERIEKTLQAKPKLVRISLNAGTEEVYNQFHNPLFPGALPRVLDSIKYFSQNKGDTAIGVGVVINEINQDNLPETALRLKEIAEAGGKIDFVAYRPEFDYYEDEQLAASLLDKTFSIVEEKVKPILDGTGIMVNNVKVRYDALKENTRNYAKCRGTGLFAEIAPSGVFFCCDRNFNRKYLIGNLEKKSMRQIASGRKRRKIQSYVDFHKCEVCPPACKSHEINRQFQQVEDLRAADEMHKVRAWIYEQRKMTKPKMVNFP